MNTMPGFYVCAHVCVNMRVHAHVPVEARGGQQMSGSITPHWIPLRQGLSLTLEATELLGSSCLSPNPGITGTCRHFQLHVVTGDLNVGSHACTTL